ncbi:MAG: hypothetical protein QXW48_01435 [Thermoplasmata archaeon]
MSYSIQIDLTRVIEQIKNDLKVWVDEVIEQKFNEFSNINKNDDFNQSESNNSDDEHNPETSSEFKEEEENNQTETSSNVIVVDGSDNSNWDYFHKHYMELKIVKFPDPRVLHMKEFKELCRKLLEIMPNHVVSEFMKPQNKIYYNLKNKIAAKAMYEKLNQIIFRSRRVIHEYIGKDRTGLHIKLGRESIEVLKEVIKEHSDYFQFD